jgi:N,N-dimethylformamidase
MRAIGYTEPWSVPRGRRVDVMVSTDSDSYEVDIVRLIHGDENPAGPGFKEEVVASPAGGRLSGRVQKLRRGSHLVAPLVTLNGGGVSVGLWGWPTRLAAGRQVLVELGGADGFRLALGADGLVTFEAGAQVVARSELPLREREWVWVSGGLDPEAALARLVIVRQQFSRLLPAETVEGRLSGLAMPAGQLLAGAGTEDGELSAHFNGKLEGPVVIGRALDGAGLASLATAAHLEATEGAMQMFDFGSAFDSSAASEVVSGRDGILVNLPQRAVTGHNWSGHETDWRHAPDEYGACWFHDDDLGDAGWETDFSWEVPADTRPGIYAARITTEKEVDHIPFFVRPAKGQPSARIALLLPTFSYLAYANDQATWRDPRAPSAVPRILDYLMEEDYRIVEEELLSLYDHHSDGSGVCYSSRRRPILTMRPKFRLAVTMTPHQLGADLYIIDWLDALGFEYDVITDEDLDGEGRDLIDGYSVVMTGSHPEYISTTMWDALEGYIADGGRLMYLGGNGWYWVVSESRKEPWYLELRRGYTEGLGWDSGPGEYHHATTGELGGYWIHRGRTGQSLTGVGFTGAGWDACLPYHRLPDSFDERVAFMFEGIGAHEPIGDFGLVIGGAGGFEIDRADVYQGTPADALVVARAEGFSSQYGGKHEDWYLEPYQQALVEHLGRPKPGEAVVYPRSLDGEHNPLLRADLVYFTTPAGGEVFSTGSIAWTGSLSHNGYDNNVSRLTANVLRRFAAGAPAAAGPRGGSV